MNDQTRLKPIKPAPTVEQVRELSPADLNDLCDATDAAIEAGGGFGWVRLPPREVLERYWRGVVTMPARVLLAARLDNVICGSVQLIKPPVNNEAQSFAVQLTGVFIAPWARGHGLARMLMEAAEQAAITEGFSIINLDVRETQDAAIKLYKTLGYEQFGQHPHYAHVDGKTIRGLYFFKTLDSGKHAAENPAP